MLREILRATKLNLLSGLRIVGVGNNDIVIKMTETLRLDGQDVIGIRDGDSGEHLPSGLYCLPGSKPPEVAVFNDPSVSAYLQEKFKFDFSNWLNLHPEIDHHDWVQTVAHILNKSEEGLWEELCSIYATTLPLETREKIVNLIEQDGC